MDNKTVQIVGVACGNGAADMGCADGPVVLSGSDEIKSASSSLRWRNMLSPAKVVQGVAGIPLIAELCEKLASDVKAIVSEGDMFLTLGGDQSCSTGTWSGASEAFAGAGDFGLIWIDAHMDAHTPQTSESGNPHGMPLAALLGFGDKALTDVLSERSKLKPENVCLIGIRSFEQGEADLLEKLGVKVFYMQDIQELGMQAVLDRAKEIVKQGTAAFGISIDMDGIDPNDAPGVGTPESNGISADELLTALPACCADPHFVGAEIVEFNPHHDRDRKTEHLVAKLIQVLFYEGS